MKTILIVIGLFLTPVYTFAQQHGNEDSIFLMELNQSIDDAVVGQNISTLTKLYSPDFIFSHGSGRVEGRTGWLNSVAKGSFILRQHDSVSVELHQELAIVKGKLTVQKKNAKATSRYNLHYIRVFAFRNKSWQLVSHRTISEIHEPDL